MLSKEQVEILTDKYITSLYDDLEREVIADIARRVKKTERFTETAELMAQSLREQGYSTARIQAEVHKYINADTEYQKALAENTRAYKQDVKKLIEQTEEAAAKAGDVFVATAGDMSWNDDMQLWKKHDVDLKKPNGLSQLYASIADQTNQEMKNITRSSGFKGTTLGTTGVLNAYQRTMDIALIKVSTGAFSYQQAVKDCVDQLAKSGLRTIDYASGRSYQLDTAVRMCIRTGANQLSGKIQEMNLAQGDTPLVYVDAHAGSRPEHAVWQGQVYAYNPDGKLRDGSKAGEKYDDFFNETDYGSPTGLMGVNCAHHFYPYWEGDPIPEYNEPDPIEIDGKEYTYYEATQEMRKQECNIRQTKREIEAMKNLGEDTSALQRKLSKQVQDYKGFSAKANINPRNYVLGVQTKKVKSDTRQLSEREREYGVKYGKDAIIANEDYLKSESYKSKYSQITDDARVNEIIYEYAVKAIMDNSGTYKESLYLLDIRDGSEVASIDKAQDKVDSGIRYTDEFISKLNEANRNKIPTISIHNHPEGYPPSLDDFSKKAENNYSISIAVGANGQVYIYYNPKNIVYDTKMCDAIHDSIALDIKRGIEIDRAYSEVYISLGVMYNILKER